MNEKNVEETKILLFFIHFFINRKIQRKILKLGKCDGLGSITAVSRLHPQCVADEPFY